MNDMMQGEKYMRSICVACVKMCVAFLLTLCILSLSLSLFLLLRVRSYVYASRVCI